MSGVNGALYHPQGPGGYFAQSLAFNAAAQDAHLRDEDARRLDW